MSSSYLLGELHLNIFSYYAQIEIVAIGKCMYMIMGMSSRLAVGCRTVIFDDATQQ